MNYLSFSFLALLFATVLSSSSMAPQYFIGYINGATQWAYPLDMCARTGLSGSQWVSCDNTGSIAMVNTYSDSSCTKLKSQANYTAADITASGVYDFNCFGTVDYIETAIYISACSSTPTLTTYGVVNVCFGFQDVTVNGTDYLAYQKVQCDVNGGTVDTYLSSSTYLPNIGCNPGKGYAELTSTLFVEPTCSYYYTLLSTSVYAQITDCVYNGISQFPQTETNSDMYPSTDFKTIYNYSFSLSPNTYELDFNITTLDLCSVSWLSLLEPTFNGTQITVTTQCTTRPENVEQTYLGSVDVEVTIGFYETPLINGSFLITCDVFDPQSMLQFYFDIVSDGVVINSYNCSTELVTTTTSSSMATTAGSTQSKTSRGNMQGVNFVILVLCFVFMYIF